MHQKERPQFYFHLRRFWQSLSPHHVGSRPLPGLLSTMYLLACHWSNDLGLISLESHFLARARKHQSDTHADPTTNMLQWLQASIMLAYYLGVSGRFLEARQEVRYARRFLKHGANPYPLERRCRYQGRSRLFCDADCTGLTHLIGGMCQPGTTRQDREPLDQANSSFPQRITSKSENASVFFGW